VRQRDFETPCNRCARWHTWAEAAHDIFNPWSSRSCCCSQAFEKGIKQHFDKCTGRPRRGRATAEADAGEDVAGDEDEEEQEEEKQDMQKLVSYTVNSSAHAVSRACLSASF